jgi:hypothetical protein
LARVTQLVLTGTPLREKKEREKKPEPHYRGPTAHVRSYSTV